MENCRFAQTCLEDQGVPEVQDEHPGDLLRSSALEPLKVVLFLRRSSEEGNGWSDLGRHGPRENTRAATSAPHSIAIAYPAGRDASATFWEGFVTLDLSESDYWMRIPS